MDELLQSVYDNPELWSTDKFHFNRGKFTLWIANGATCCKPTSISDHVFSYQDKRTWWKAYRWWCKNAPATKLTGEKSC